VYLKKIFRGPSLRTPRGGGGERKGREGRGRGNKGKEKGGREGRERRRRGYGWGGKGLGPPMFDTDRRPCVYTYFLVVFPQILRARFNEV
jgi:hypothetical protein